MELARFPFGDVTLRSSAMLEDAVLAYATWGRLNAAGDNCILLPTYYTGTHQSYAGLIGPGRVLDPDRYFIVSPNMFGNGVSTSPSHRPAGAARAAFPAVDIHDNVACQHRLLSEHLGVRRIALAAGWSMGAMQAYSWAAAYPEMVEALLPICGTSRCWPLNRVFLEGVAAALRADGNYAGGAYLRPPTEGLKAFGRAYCGWAYSAPFFREALYRQLGADSLEAFLVQWEDEHLSFDAGDLLAMLGTWANADIGTLPGCGGDYRAALSRITARTIAMPCRYDAYFTAEEAAHEASFIPGAQLEVLDSVYGHCAGAPGRFPAETAKIEQAMRELLAR